MSDSYPDGAFFRLTEMPNDGFKVVVSTCPNRQGIGQRIKPGSLLCYALEVLSNPAANPRRSRLTSFAELAELRKLGLAQDIGFAVNSVWP
jgi:hypothetical protein